MKDKLSTKRCLLLVLSTYTALGYIIFALWQKIIPMPFGEGAALIYGWFSTGSWPIAALMIALILFCIFALAFLAFRENKMLPLKIILSVIAVVDCGIHIYVFMMSSGIVWTYLLSSLFDIVLICTLFLKDEKDEVKKIENTDIEGGKNE